MRPPKLIMVLVLSLFMLVLMAGLSVTTAQAPNVVRWEQIFGTTLGGRVGTGAGEVQGSGPWVTTGGKASVNLTTGRLRFEVQGLVQARDKAVGTPGPITEVIGTLVCDTDSSASESSPGAEDGDSLVVDTSVVPLSPQGDAKFDGNVVLFTECIDEPDIAFLVRLPDLSGTPWIAFGAVRVP